MRCKLLLAEPALLALARSTCEFFPRALGHTRSAKQTRRATQTPPTRRAALSKRKRAPHTKQTRRDARRTNHQHGAPPPPKRSGLDKKRPGLDDMTLLTKPTPQGIRDNLKERLEAECIYTYIGNVLVAANPFTWLQIYSSEDAKRYMRQRD